MLLLLVKVRPVPSQHRSKQIFHLGLPDAFQIRHILNIIEHIIWVAKRHHLDAIGVKMLVGLADHDTRSAFLARVAATCSRDRY